MLAALEPARGQPIDGVASQHQPGHVRVIAHVQTPQVAGDLEAAAVGRTFVHHAAKAGKGARGGGGAAGLRSLRGRRCACTNDRMRA